MEGLEQWKNEAVQRLQEGIDYLILLPPASLYTVIAVLLSTLFLVTFQLVKRKNRSTIVLAGPSGSGKTVMFRKLIEASAHEGTVTSMEQNEAIFELRYKTNKGRGRSVHLVDVPGDPRLRANIDNFIHQTAGVVFVVDAVDFLLNLQNTSEYLHDILTKTSVVKRKIPLLICCNKMDKVTAHTVDFIKKQLQKEIGKLSQRRNKVSEADVCNDIMLGITGKEFDFSQCLNKVSIGGACVLNSELSTVLQFIGEHVK